MTWRKIIPGVFESLPLEASLRGRNRKEPDLLEKLSNMPFTTQKTHRFETWEHRGNESWWPMVERYKACNYDHPFITLLGESGTGKTHIAFAIGWAWLAQGKSVLYYQVESLLDALREGYSKWEKGDSDGYNRVLKFAQNAGLLILDDFGVQHETKWANSKLDQIVDYRYEHQKPLLATTNLSLNRLPPRIVDRLTEGWLIHLMGESFRKQKNANRKHEEKSK